MGLRVVDGQRSWTEIVESLAEFVNKDTTQLVTHEISDPEVVPLERVPTQWFTMDVNGFIGAWCAEMQSTSAKVGYKLVAGKSNYKDFRFTSPRRVKIITQMIKHYKLGACSSSCYTGKDGTDYLISCQPNTGDVQSGEIIIDWVDINAYNDILYKSGWHQKRFMNLEENKLI